MKPEDIANMNKTLDALEDFATKADASGMRVDNRPGNKTPSTLTIDVPHGPGKESKDAAVSRAHAVAADHGYDPAGHDMGPSWHNGGDAHMTRINYTKPC